MTMQIGAQSKRILPVRVHSCNAHIKEFYNEQEDVYQGQHPNMRTEVQNQHNGTASILMNMQDIKMKSRIRNEEIKLAVENI